MPTKCHQYNRTTMNSSKLIRYEANKRTFQSAFILCLLFGFLGMHRFYLEKNGSGLTMLTFSVFIIGIPISLLWAFIDLFFISLMVQEYNNELVSQIDGFYSQDNPSQHEENCNSDLT